MEGWTKRFGGYLLSMLDTFVKEMAAQESMGDEYLAEYHRRYRRSTSMDRAAEDKKLKELQEKGLEKKHTEKVQVAKITSASVEKLAFQVLSPLPFSYFLLVVGLVILHVILLLLT